MDRIASEIWWADRGSCAAHQVEESRPRLWFEERWYSNKELHEGSCRLAGALTKLGIGADDRVVVLTSNCPEVLVSYPAIWRAGAVAAS